MKSLKLIGLLSVFALLTFTGCLEDKCETTHTYQIWEPVYMTPEEIRQDIVATGPQTLENPGKIYYYQDYLFVNERNKGIHVIDNQDPTSPNPISFIEIPGNIDMAIRGNLLYANNYIDLVSIDLSNPAAPTFAGRSEEVFPVDEFDPERGYLVEYIPTDETQTFDCNDPNGGGNPIFWINNRVFVDVAFDLSSNETAGVFNSGAVAGATGIGGSMARFTITQDHLYVVDDRDLRVFDLGNATQPDLATTVNIGWGIETIFPYEDNLFIGSSTGMFIYDNSNPLSPVQLAVFEHARACDPVFVSGNLAYVTLRDGTQCEGFANQLDVVDITNLTEPVLLASHAMHNPRGLSVVGDNIYICEGDEGLKVFDATDWQEIGDSLLDHVKGLHTFDIIGLGPINLAIVTGEDGIYQFDISDASNLKQLSLMQANK